MVNKTMCKCSMTCFTVSDIMATSANGGQVFFNVYAECVDCKEYQVIAVHIMPVDGCKELFYEHHQMTKEFYEEVE